jgi:hypothetical protein
MNTRGDFLKKTSLAVLTGLGTSAASPGVAEESKDPKGVSQLKAPVAIAMWDFSWLLRHYPTGEFENWDAVLDGLESR